MDYVFLVATLLASIYTYTFARWLKKTGNKAGAFGMHLMIVSSIAVVIYRIFIK